MNRTTFALNIAWREPCSAGRQAHRHAVAIHRVLSRSARSCALYRAVPHVRSRGIDWFASRAAGAGEAAAFDGAGKRDQLRQHSRRLEYLTVSAAAVVAPLQT